MNVVIQFDPTPRPLAMYCELWGKDASTLTKWAKKGWIPGVFKHQCGEWWVRPLELIDYNPLESENHEKSEGSRERRQKGQQVPREEADRWTRRIRRGADDEVAS